MQPGTMFGVPPPNPDPQFEGEYLRSPGDRLKTYVFGFIAITIVVIAIAVIQSVT